MTRRWGWLVLLAGGCTGVDEEPRAVMPELPDRGEMIGAACRPGINPGAPVWNGIVTLDQERAARLAGTGAKTIRLDFRREGGWDEAALARYDEVLANVQAAGLVTHGLVTYEAIAARQEAWNDDPDGDGLNDAVGEFADTFAMLVERYGDRVTRWELWNEPNCYGSGDYREDPQHAGCYYVLPRVFAHMIADSYLRVRGRVDDGSIQLVVGGLLAQDIWGPLNPGTDYLQEMYADGVWGWLEGETGRRFPWSTMGIHPYVDQDRASDGTQLLAVIDQIEGVMNGYGDAATIAVSEVGWTVLSVDPQTQADNLTNSYRVLGAHPRIDEVSWFSYADAPDAGLYFGLVDVQGNPRPAHDALWSLATTCATEEGG